MANKKITHKLGRGELRIDNGGPGGSSRTLKFAAYAVPSVKVPVKCDWAATVKQFRSLGNHRIADCSAVMIAHIRQAWLANESNRQWQPQPKPVVGFYSAVSGYKKGHPKTDTGVDMLSVMNAWRKTGLAGHKIDAFAAVDHTNLDEMRKAIWLAGALAVGIAMPIVAQQWTKPGSKWDVPRGGPVGNAAPWSWGGHAVPLLGYNAKKGTWLAVSWAGTYTLTDAFVQTYCEEAYIPWSPNDWCASGRSPNGFRAKALLADVNALTA